MNFKLKRVYCKPGESGRAFCERLANTPVDFGEIIVAVVDDKHEFFVYSSDRMPQIMDKFQACIQKTVDEWLSEDEEPKLDIYNPEHYLDTTAYHAINNAEGRPDDWLPPDKYRASREKRYRLIGCIFRLCELAGFTVMNRIELRDNETGKVWK